MKKNNQLILYALLLGILGFIVLFVFGSISKKGEVGLVAASIFYLYSCFYLARKQYAGWWYIGFLINIPNWIIIAFLADPGILQEIYPDLIILLIVSYAGSLIGLWFIKKSIELNKLVKILLIAIPLVIIISVIFIMNRPKPIPNDKLSFVGSWQCSNFELNIMPDGKATIKQNESDRGFEYEHLNIKVAPSHITDLKVNFRADSILILSRPGYYAREYRIDKFPYSDSNNVKLVLNGATLVKKQKN